MAVEGILLVHAEPDTSSVDARVENLAEPSSELVVLDSDSSGPRSAEASMHCDEERHG